MVGRRQPAQVTGLRLFNGRSFHRSISRHDPGGLQRLLGQRRFYAAQPGGTDELDADSCVLGAGLRRKEYGDSKAIYGKLPWPVFGQAAPGFARIYFFVRRAALCSGLAPRQKSKQADLFKMGWFFLLTLIYGRTS